MPKKKAEKDLLDDIMEAEDPGPNNEQLEEVAGLAKRQLFLLGVNSDGNYLEKAPTSTTLDKLKSWAKQNRVDIKQEDVKTPVSECSISQLVAVLLSKLTELRTLGEVTIPQLLFSLGLENYSLTGGFSVKVEEDLVAGFKAEHEQEAVSWLIEHNLGGVVRNEIKLDLGPGDYKQAVPFYELAKKMGLALQGREFVHPATFKALVKEQRAKGVEFPDAYFNVHVFNKTTVKAPK